MNNKYCEIRFIFFLKVMGLYIAGNSVNNLHIGSKDCNGAYVNKDKVRPNQRLPVEYQEVEYIQSSGSQYINTGVSGSGIASWEIQFNTLTSKARSYEMYCGGGSGHPTSGKVFHQDYGSYRGVTFQHSNSSERLLFQLQNVVHTIKMLNGSLEMDGTYLQDYTPGEWGGYFWIFGNSGESSLMSSMQLYYMKLYTDGVIVRDFVPCYRKSDSVVGLYDLVGKTFYTNSGTGTFSKGSDV